MKFIYGKNHFKDFKSGNENCYLLTNGLGGYSSTTLINSLTRADHSLFTIAIKAPNLRKNIVNKISEVLILNGKRIPLSSQQYVCHTKNIEGFNNVQSFKQQYLPEWTYFFDGVYIKKTIVFQHLKNTLGIKYTIENNSDNVATLELTPVFQFANRGKTQKEKIDFKEENNKITFENLTLSINSNYSEKIKFPLIFENDYYFSYDAVDGRESIGSGTTFLSYLYNCKANSTSNYEIILSTERENLKSVDSLINEEVKRQKDLIENSGFKDEMAKTLVRASDQFITNRDSTSAKTIIAGYPWFEDWGRDTMFAVLGSCISTKRFEDAKGIFKSFIKYKKNGLMPNLFPEGDKEPIYNTVDASLLFIYALYEYYIASEDLDFIKSIGLDTAIDIIENYKSGTDFNIYMDNDYLINAGSGYDQVTWMDIRFDKILPTPRHGKPVEINGFWYNALKVVEFFLDKLKIDSSQYSELATKVRESFNKKFWNDDENCLKDVVSGKDYDNQVRSNQIWTVMIPYSPINLEKQKLVVKKVYQELYTPYGLRTLSKYDREFKENYGGSHFNRDMAYHQGTVWPFPLGGYFIAYLKVNNYSEASKEKVKELLEDLKPALWEGCVGQLPEIYDGLNPSNSKGCFAQGWSVSEILRVFSFLDR